MPPTVALRPATPADLPAVDGLLARSYPQLLKGDYPPSVLVAVLPAISRAKPALLASGTYWLAEADGAVLACGGWTAAAPTDGGRAAGIGHVRHVATDPAHTRRGFARAVMARAMMQAAGAGVRTMECLSTRTAVPFYAAIGFRWQEELDVAIGGAIPFPAIRMTARLRTDPVRGSA
ncbi:GNAT family N-acetyltransferase [Jannaschia sp. Os4]|uniref:GNAT family N-acetyltransferase n=1 Tax=Jannaschia sp. Os4 TaxID=2807617 RepID=UPI00193A4427|nr:GNAT family N-acetyltransferase [Jannaschia sp. Os4]MBM2575351.1 GNAT family N-acetyltransferase [Jannaschia sp. Os4]